MTERPWSICRNPIADKCQRFAAPQIKGSFSQRMNCSSLPTEETGAHSKTSLQGFSPQESAFLSPAWQRAAALCGDASDSIQRGGSAAVPPDLPWSRASAQRKEARAYRDAPRDGKMRSVGPLSTASPRNITTVRSAISATTPISCVMKRTDMPSSSCNVLIDRGSALDRHVERGRRLVRYSGALAWRPAPSQS